MKKISLTVTLLLAVLLLQKCKKDSVTAVVSSTNTLFAYIDGTEWVGDTINAVITYNSATKTKVLSCVATGNNKQIKMSVTQQNATNTPGFPLSTFTADSSKNNLFAYLTAQKNNSGNYSFVQVGTVQNGSGNLIVTGIDSVKKTITGTFGMTVKQYNANNTLTIVQISSGAFNSMPYTFVSN
jgi:hypothetical protein